MTEQPMKDWMKDNRYSSHKFATYLCDMHKLKISAETVQRWMRGFPVSERYRKTVAKVTKLRIDKEGKVTPPASRL